MTAPDPTALVAVEMTDREVVYTRLIQAPRERVFDAWTTPEKIGQWWGPVGFTTTTQGMDFRPGGEWRFVMHGPDGRDYPNRIVYGDIEPPSRLVCRMTGQESDADPVIMEIVVTFEAFDGGTRLTFRQIFPTPEALKHVVEAFGAIEGARQTLTRLAGYAEENG